MRRARIIVILAVVAAMAHGCSCSGNDQTPCGNGYCTIGQVCSNNVACVDWCGHAEETCCPGLTPSCLDGLVCQNGSCVTAPPKDSGASHMDHAIDSKDACPSGTSCEFCDVSGFNSPTMGKPRQALNACDGAQLQAFVAACSGTTSTQAKCTALLTMDAGVCSACLTPVLQSDTSWGPFDCATAQSPCGTNSGGCVDLVLPPPNDDSGAGTCGDLVTANFACQDYACGTCNDVDFTICDQSAIAVECKSYADAATSTTGACAPINVDAEPAGIASCFPKTDAQNVDFINIFCGTGISP